MSVLTAQQRVLLGPLLFTSDFDGGNLGRVERIEQPVSTPTADATPVASSSAASGTASARGHSGAPSVRSPPATKRGSAGGPANSPCEEYIVSVAPDCASTAHETHHRTWFFFGMSLVPRSGERDCCMTPETALASPTSCGLGIAEGATLGTPRACSGDVEDVPPKSSAAVPQEAMTINLTISNMTNQEKLFKEGYRPWLRKVPSDSAWRRLPDSPEASFSYQWCGEPAEGGTGFTIRWRQQLEPGSTVYVAFCVPFGYTDCQRLLDTLEGNLLADPDDVSAQSDRSQNPLRCISDALQESWVPRPGTNIYFHRQTWAISLDGRNIDLLTLTSDASAAETDSQSTVEAASTANLDSSREEQLNCGEPSTPSSQLVDIDTHAGSAAVLEGLEAGDVSCTPEGSPEALFAAAGLSAREFEHRPLVFLSARVHPGETPGTFAFLGLLRFLLSDDPRARWLRDNFVFKLVPMLNPDGVARGHHRTNSQGLDLNRCYSHPVHSEHEGVWLVKQFLLHWASRNRLLFCVDFHGHPTRRGCFLLGNRSTGARQAWSLTYARLCQLNSPHFDIDACDFAAPVPAAADCSNIAGAIAAEGGAAATMTLDPAASKHGTARAAIYRDCQLNHAYTFECNYHSGRSSKPLHVAPGLPDWAACPGSATKTQAAVPFDPSCWAQAGEAIGVSLLDLYGHNCCSRLLGSRYGSLSRLLSLSPSLGSAKGSQQSPAEAVPSVKGLRFRTVAEQQQSCDNANCGWAMTPKQLDMLAKEFNSSTTCFSCGSGAVYPWVNSGNGTEAPHSPTLPGGSWQQGAMARRAAHGTSGAPLLCATYQQRTNPRDRKSVV